MLGSSTSESSTTLVEAYNESTLDSLTSSNFIDTPTLVPRWLDFPVHKGTLAMLHNFPDLSNQP